MPASLNQNVTIFLPRLHRANVFLHVLIGHELFHPTVVAFVDSERAIVSPAIRDQCKKLVTPAFPLFDQQRLDQLVSYSLSAWEKGLTELMCDMGAAAIFGPAALWSVSSFATTLDQDHEPNARNEFYPSWRFRLATMIEYLEEKDQLEVRMEKLCNAIRKSGLGDHATAFESGVRNEKENVATSTVHIKDPFVRIAYDRIADSLARAKDEIQRQSRQISERWVDTFDQVPKLLQRFALKVPPSEMLEPWKTRKPSSKFDGNCAFSVVRAACGRERGIATARVSSAL